MPKYTNPEMRNSMRQMKEKPRKIKITGGSVSTREPLATSSKRAKSMTSSGLPKTTTSTKKPATPMPGVRRPRKTTTTANRKQLAAKEVKVGKTTVKMVGGIVPVMSKPKKRMF